MAEQTIRVQEYSKSFCGALHNLQKQNILCDTTLHLRDGQVNVHGVVLLATGYGIFANLHIYNVDSPQIHIHHFKDESIKLVKMVIELLYTGETVCPLHCIKELHRFCQTFSLDKVTEEVERVLKLENVIFLENVHVPVEEDCAHVNCQIRDQSVDISKYTDLGQSQMVITEAVGTVVNAGQESRQHLHTGDSTDFNILNLQQSAVQAEIHDCVNIQKTESEVPVSVNELNKQQMDEVCVNKICAAIEMSSHEMEELEIETQSEADAGEDEADEIDIRKENDTKTGSDKNDRKRTTVRRTKRLNFGRKKKIGKKQVDAFTLNVQTDSNKMRELDDGGGSEVCKIKQNVKSLARTLRRRVTRSIGKNHLDDLESVKKTEKCKEFESDVQKLWGSNNIAKKAKIVTDTRTKHVKIEMEIENESKESEKHPQRSTSVCYLCDKNYQNVKALREHNIKTHPQIVKCNKCELEINVSELNKHYRLHHFVCDLCDFKPIGTKDLETKLAEHKLKKHEEIYNEQRFPILRCEEMGCKFISVHWTKIQQHRKIVHEPPKHKCEFCGRACATLTNLRIHKEAVHSTVERQYKFECTHCLKKFVSRGHLNGHMKFHKKELMCHICSKCCSTKTDLAVHMYTQHKIMSPNLRMYKCKHCDYQVYSSWAFKSHVASKHGGTKDYVCQDCGKQFYASKNLNDHLKIHKGIKYKCPIEGCSFSTIYKSALYRKHIPTIHTEKDIKNSICHICDYRCRNNHTLKAHIKLKHQLVLSGQEIKQIQQSLNEQFKLFPVELNSDRRCSGTV